MFIVKWAGFKNGELLQQAAIEGFDVLVRNDRGLQYQQNLETLPLAVVVLRAKVNTVESLGAACPDLLEVVSRLRPREFVTIDQP